MSTETENNSSSGSSPAEPRVISPTGIPGVDDAAQPLNDFSRTDADDIPSQHYCIIANEPPFDAVHFDVPDSNGTTIQSGQVYERSAMYRCIGTRGKNSAFRNIIHPFTRVSIPRLRAWDYVQPVDPALQVTLHRERLSLNLPMCDEHPINDNDRARYDKTMRRCAEQYVFYSEKQEGVGGIKQSSPNIHLFFF
jgi:hypothetical protein